MKPLISLDVFDTAIFRKVFNPTDIFDVVEEKVGNNFKALRIKAQEQARKKSIFYNIIDIYKEISFPFSPKEEIKAEYENCKANPYILNLYNKQEADYIFISDMYLPSLVIKSMLEKCGYKNPQVFVSCELKAVKGNGSLFQKVESNLGRKIFKHIGDNYSCDIVGAQKVRVPEVQYVGPPIYNKEVTTPNIESVKLRKLLIDEELSNNSIEEKIGYIFAPLALAFTQAILNEASANQTIFFNARDGFLLYVIARWILKTKKNIKYCRFSRKSCFVANVLPNYMITHSSNSASLKFFKIQRIHTLRDFLKLFSLDENYDYSKVLNKYKITLDTVLEFNKNKQAIIEDTLLSVQDKFYSVVMECKRNFLKYVQKIGIKNGDFFVDLGYNGTMQGILTRIAGLKLHGRYINTFDLRGEFQGVLFEKRSFLPISIFRPHGGAALEAVFSENRGTVVRYDAAGNPVLGKDTKYKKDFTKKILKGLFRGVKDILREDIKLNKEDCSKIILRFLNNPTVEEAQCYNKRVFENGSYNCDESIVWFDEEQIRRGKVRECYIRSYWKTAFKLLLSQSGDFKELERYI